MKFESLSPLQSEEVNEALTSFGLLPNEQAVYLALLSYGPNTITPLGRSLHLPITTVQSIANRLHERGLLQITKNKSRHIYSALDPIVLKKIIEERLREVSTVIPLLKTLETNVKSTNKISIYYRERVADILQSALQTKQKTIYEIVAAQDFQKLIGEKFHFTRRRVAKNIQLKSLRVIKREIKKYDNDSNRRELREARFLPTQLTFHASIIMWDDTVAFFSTKEEGLAWTVESKVLRETFQQLFDLLWEIGRKIN